MIMEKYRIIFETLSGSHLYGTNTENSDHDYQGIFLPSKEYILGIERCEELNLSHVVKDENNKNTKDAVDRKFHELRKFINLILKGNPNIIELLFTNKESIQEITYEGQLILEEGPKLLSKNFIKPFKGYMLSEYQKYNNPYCTGYKDNKKAYHIYRLMCEALELMYNGCITFPLVYSDILKNIKNGEMDQNEIDLLLIQKLDKFNKTIEEFDKSDKHFYKFSKKSNRKLANMICMDIYNIYLKM